MTIGAYPLVGLDGVGAAEADAVPGEGGPDVAGGQEAPAAQRERLVVRVQCRVHGHHARVQLLALRLCGRISNVDRAKKTMLRQRKYLSNGANLPQILHVMLWKLPL